MKRLFASVILLAVLVFSCGCAYKTMPAIKINHDNVTSLNFKKTVFSNSDPLGRDYYQKTVTEKDDIESILKWIESLKLTRNEAIEVPLEQVEYVIELVGVKIHKLVFFNGYVVYDSIAYTYDKPEQEEQTAQKYNLLNYLETETELNLV